jgi:colanic acid/amylovoran biosynthesis glycosyltransferase
MSRDRDRPIHLLEVGVRWPPETFIAWKLEGLATRGMRVTVASKKVYDPDAEVPGVELLRLPPRPLTKGAALRTALVPGLALLVRSPRRLVRLVRGARRRARGPGGSRYGGTLGLVATCLPLAHLRPDVVHFEWHSSAVDHLPLFDVWGCPVTTSARGSDISVYPHIPGSEAYASGLPEVFERVSAVHCVSESLAREAAELGLDPAKAVVARPAMDPELFRPDETGKGDGLAVVMVGWLRWEKGYEYALEAIRLADRAGIPVRLEIIGDVPPERRSGMDELTRIRHTASDLGVADLVTLRGGGTSAQIARRLRSSHVLMHPSLSEGIPVAVVEGMATELPVVVTDVGGLTEAVTDGVEGIVVPPRDPAALAAALDRLWRDPELRRRMGRAGRERASSEFALRDEHEAFMSMYRQAAGR